MTVTIGEAMVKLSGDSSGLSRSLDQGKAQLDAAARRIGQSAGQQIGEGTKRGLAGMVGGIVDTFGKIGLAAMGVKAVAGVVTGALAGPVMAASDLNEAVNKTDVVFGKASKSVHDFATTAAQALGLSRTEAESAAGTFGNLFVAMGIGKEKSATMSKSILTLAADLASFNNIDPTDALEKLRAGLVGETEPLRTLGVNLSADAIEAKALAMGLGRTTTTVKAASGASASLAKNQEKAAAATLKVRGAELDVAQARDRLAKITKKYGQSSLQAQQAAQTLAEKQAALAKAQRGSSDALSAHVSKVGKAATKTKVELSAADKAEAAYALILEQTKTAQGDFARTSTGMANSLRIIKASFADITTEVGNRLLPVVAPLISGVAKALPAAFKVVAPPLDLFGRAVSRVFGAVEKAVGSVNRIRLALIKSLTGLDLSPLTVSVRSLFVAFKTGTSAVGAFEALRRLLGLDPARAANLLTVFAKLGEGYRTFKQYVSDVAHGGTVLSSTLSKLPGYMQPVAKVVGGLVGLFGALGHSFKLLLTGEGDIQDFFTRVRNTVKTYGPIILSTFGDVGKKIWGYLFARDDATGTSKTGEFVDWAKDKLETKAKETFAEAKGLGLDLYRFIFGGPSTTSGDSATSFLVEHKGLITFAAKSLFGPVGVIASYLLPWLFGNIGGKGDEKGATSASELLGSLKERLVSTAEDIFNGTGIISDVWAFLFGGKSKDPKLAGITQANTWSDGIVTKLYAALKAAFQRQTSGFNIWQYLFGATTTEQIDASSTTKESSGVVTQLLSKLSGWLDEAANKLKTNPTFLASANALGTAVADVLLGAVGFVDPERQKTTADKFAELGSGWGKTLIDAFVKELTSSENAKRAGEAMLSALVDEQLKDPVFGGMWAKIFETIYGKEAIDARLERLSPPTIAPGKKGGSLPGLFGPTTKGAMIPANGSGSSPFAEQMASLFDPIALDIPNLGEKIGLSLSDGVARGIASGQGAIAVALDLMLTPRLALAQADTIDAMTTRMNPYRPARAR